MGQLRHHMLPEYLLYCRPIICCCYLPGYFSGVITYIATEASFRLFVVKNLILRN